MRQLVENVALAVIQCLGEPHIQRVQHLNFSLGIQEALRIHRAVPAADQFPPLIIPAARQIQLYSLFALDLALLAVSQLSAPQ
ncbi:hypothetical protein [Xenorhabdus sp. IM139775]|uniref:hypothetical protein n=1 Tax=Xenorhabdus sp. IM139775 TaxID=3025876 RepID=UPI0023582390|nr:hypothetical protein [Xenorhabdus sp. IM139775]MDC9594824.1 hypothetical protein [Xenorhabdus sp. IM139775]